MPDAARPTYQDETLGWSVPVMRFGYVGRGIVYLVIAGFSLYAIWQGGDAKGTSSAFADLDTTFGGAIVLLLIFFGMLAYAVWRFVDCYFDLEDKGDDLLGLFARAGMILTALTHLGIGLTALSLLFAASGGGGGSSVVSTVSSIMAWPGGRWLIVGAGAVTASVGIYYGYKGVTQSYRQKLKANSFTTHWNGLLRAGLISYGTVILIVGGYFVFAGWTVDPSKAGGLEKAFDFLDGQLYGRLIVTAVCIGLLGFAAFLFVNAAFRIIPKLADDSVVSLAHKLESKARRAIG